MVNSLQELKDERRQIDNKIDDLNVTFRSVIFNTLSDTEKNLLTTQHTAMSDYSNILTKRISFINNGK